MTLLDTPRRQDTTLLLIDIQPVIQDHSHTLPAKSVRRAAETAVKLARMLDIPAFVSLVPTGPTPPKAVSELEDVPAYPRGTFGAFDQPEIREAIGASGRKVLAIGGIVSEIAVLQGARTAIREGYTVYILTDCCGGVTERSEAAAFSELQRAGAILSSVLSFFTTFGSEISGEQRQEMMTVATKMLTKE